MRRTSDLLAQFVIIYLFITQTIDGIFETCEEIKTNLIETYTYSVNINIYYSVEMWRTAKATFLTLKYSTTKYFYFYSTSIGQQERQHKTPLILPWCYTLLRQWFLREWITVYSYAGVTINTKSYCFYLKVFHLVPLNCQMDLKIQRKHFAFLLSKVGV